MASKMTFKQWIDRLWDLENEALERERAEQALEESEERYRLIFNGSRDAVFIANTDSKFVDVNDAASELTGYSKEALKKMSIPDLHEKVDLHADEDFLNRIMSGEAIISKAKIQRKDGTTIDTEFSNRRVLIGNAYYMHTVVRDVTEKNLAEKTLKESEERYRQLFEMESDAIFLIENETGKILEVNPAGPALYGYSREELLGMDHTQVSSEPDNTRETTLGRQDNVPIRWHQKRDGTVFPVEITARHFIWKGRQVHIAAIRDIEFRVKVEKERKHIESQLHRAQRVEALGVMAVGIAHDFNNMLSPIMGHAEMMLLKAKKGGYFQKGLNDILLVSNKAKELIDQILAFGRQEKKERKLLKIQSVLKECLRIINAMLPASIVIRHDIKKDCGLVMADPTQIQQIVMNLAINAFQAMGDTGGILKINLDEVGLGSKDLKNPDMIPGRYACLIVSDTGAGIKESIRDKIFDPYFTTKERGKGTGLGLSVVYGIAKSYRGDIRFFSQRGKGSIFKVYLPVAKSPRGARRKEIPGPILKGNEHILVVDDELPAIKIMQEILEHLGYQITARTSSIEALEAFRHQPDRFDLVLTDLTMPNMSGVRLAKELLKIQPDTPVVLCIGYSEQIDKEAASEIGIKGFVMKPIVMKELARIIRKVLDKD
jgi:PAS domain S-box-containing protein